jgi:predicted metal-dependent enzyme (double-stranded beta helix superfamily)
MQPHLWLGAYEKERKAAMSDEYLCDTPEVRHFAEQVKAILEKDGLVSEKLAAIRPHFSRMMEDPTWLPDEFRRTQEVGGMGAGIANWLLYRDTNGTLSLAALVLPPGAVTPVHDHLAWGLVGLYVGEQDEEVFEPGSPIGQGEPHANLRLVAKTHLQVGSFYELIPPSGDIHRVTTTSAEPSISLHLLTNDVGCVLRHRFVPETGEVAPFRSGYSNIECGQP